MEDRKGWRDLVRAYMAEFKGAADASRVLLLLRTYVHVEGVGFTNSRAEVRCCGTCGGGRCLLRFSCVLTRALSFVGNEEDQPALGKDGRVSTHSYYYYSLSALVLLLPTPLATSPSHNPAGTTQRQSSSSGRASM